MPKLSVALWATCLTPRLNDVGAVGGTPYRAEPEANVSGAAVYLPCEEQLGATGVFAAIPPRGEDGGVGPMLLARDIPLDAIRATRGGASEVWRGVRSAKHLSVDDPKGKAR